MFKPEAAIGEMFHRFTDYRRFRATIHVQFGETKAMSAEGSVRSAILAREDAERGHRTRCRLLAWLVALAMVW